jgi:hypothetical protein
MPPRRSARVAAVAEQQCTALAQLPLALVLRIFALLPADSRAAASAVCRGWRATLRDQSLWARLDLSAASGVRCEVTNDVMLDAAARAGGALQALDVSGCGEVNWEAVRLVATDNRATLRELRTSESCSGLRRLPILEALLAAAPLTLLEADVDSTTAEARVALRGEPPFGALGIRSLGLNLNVVDADGVVALAVDLAGHASLTELSLLDAALDAPAALEAIVDVTRSRRLRRLSLSLCRLAPPCAPALARVLTSDALTALVVDNGEAALLDAPAALLFANALRLNSTLTSLGLQLVQLWDDAAAATALLGALAGHPSLRELDLSDNRAAAEHAAALAPAFAALGALVAADAAALTLLDVSYCELGDAGLTPLFDALPGNTHLRVLVCGDNGLSRAFARGRLLRAVRANAALRELDTDEAAAEAEELVAERAAEAEEEE